IPLLGRSHSEEVAAATDEESAVGQAEEKRILRSAQNDGTVFWAVSRAGKELADLHLNYENLDPYPLKWMENRSVPLSYRVEDKMRLSKDKTQVKVNESLTLAGIPPETFEYRLGNRSALEWVIDQYQVTERNGIRSDPNRPGDEQYIVRLVGQVIRVSLETVRLVSSLPPLAGAQTPQEK
ncbi:MAG: type ISP restriction/modification enzyme, partial [Terriglobia bacterium]